MSFIIDPYKLAAAGPTTPPVFDAVSTNGADATGLSWSHTVANQSNRILLVFIFYWNDSRTISGVTYNGVALTHLAGPIASGADARRSMTVWYLLNPAIGTNTIVVTGTGAAADKQATAFSAYNAAQSAPSGVTGSGFAIDAGVTLTGDSGYLFFDGFGVDSNSSPFAVGANQTERSHFAQGAQTMGSSTAPGVVSEYMNWVLTSGSPKDWALIAVKALGAA